MVERAELIDIVSLVPALTLLDALRENRVVTDFEDLRKRASDDVAQAPKEIIGLVIDKYAELGKTDLLLSSLYQRSYLNAAFTTRVLPLLRNGQDDEKQRFIAERANTVPQQELAKFICDVGGMVCIVVAVDGVTNKAALGTGFLVNANQILTAFHTLKSHVVDGKARPPVPGDRLFALFDHSEGNPIKGECNEQYNGKLRVNFARDWLRCCCEDMPYDGQFLEPDADQLALLPNRLDFALVELAEPVGSYERPRSGGLSRSWVPLAEATNSLRNDDAIFIPQHPFGQRLGFGFGRYSTTDSDLDKSSTRIRYDTDADKGSSGSPCFNQHFKLVGMHNAAFEPHKIWIKKNQAIRADRIRARMEIQAGAKTSRPIPWTISNDADSMQPILGRKVLFSWLEAAGRDTITHRADRVFATIEAPERSGKSFTTEILVAARRGLPDPIVALGNREEVPVTVTDFIRVICYMLRIPKELLKTLPPRPDVTLPKSSQNGDGDKLRKWASEDVPKWFADLLRAHRTQEVARWEIGWIVLDGLNETALTEEVSDLIGGLMGGTLAESQVNPELLRLRWLFLGAAPTFLPGDEVTGEKLDPCAIGPEDIIDTIGRMLVSYGKKYDAEVADNVRRMLAPWIENEKDSLANPLTRMAVLQVIALKFARAFRQLLGIPT